MANTIKLKRASGSDPGASDLVVGEVALRTDTAKLFTKKDDNSIAEIGGTATVADDAISTSKIQDDAVTYAKIQNVSATDRLLGRDSSGAGVIEEIAPSAVRTMLGLASSATTDTTNASNISSGTLAAARVATLNQDTTGNAATATALETARTIAGVSFDGSANISLNNNAITNGAGYITTVADTTIAPSTIDMEDNEKIKLGNSDDLEIFHDGSNSYIKDTGTGNLFVHSNQFEVLNADGSQYLLRSIGGASVELYEAGSKKFETSSSGVSVTGNIVVSGTVDGRDLATDGSKLDGIAAGATNVSNTNQLTNGAGFITATLTDEQVEDIVGGMVTGNTESGITVTYQDSDGTLDFSVASQTDNNFTTTLKNKLDGIAAGATNVTNNNQLTNGAGYITSANGGNAATLDSLDSSQFLRSDTNDTSSSKVSFNGGIACEDTCSSSINSLTDGSTITVSFTGSIHHTVTLGGNRTLNQSNAINAIGQSGSIFIIQDGTGSRTLSFNSAFKFAGGTAPTLSTAANAIDRIDYVIRGDANVHCAFTADVK